MKRIIATALRATLLLVAASILAPVAHAELKLHYNFAFDKSLIARKGPTLSITRASSATYIDSAGVMQTAAGGVARFDHSPVSPFTSLGLLVEETRKNIARQSGNLVSAPWTSIQTPALATNNAISPRGILEATLITDNNVTNREGVQQSISVPNTTDTHVTSIFVRKTTGATSPTFGLEMVYADGAGTVPVQIRLNTDTGVSNGVGDGGVQDFGDWWRLWGLSTNNFSGNRTLLIKVLPALAAHGSFVDVMSTNGSAHAWGIQSEIGSTPTSYIETFGGTVFRQGDVITTTDVSWLNVLEGTFFTDTLVPEILESGGGTPAIFSLDDGTNNNRILHTYDREPGIFRSFAFMTALGGTAHNINETALALVPRDILKMASSWGDTTLTTISNGISIRIKGGITVPQGLNTLRFGIAAFADTQNNGHYRELRYYNVRLDNTILEALSNGVFPDTKGGVKVSMSGIGSTL